MKRNNHIVSTTFKNSKKLLEEYSKAVEAGSVVSRTDINGNITFVDEQFCKMSGYSEEELIGKQHNILRHPDVSKKLYENLWKTIKNKQVWQGKIKNKTKNGASYYVYLTIVPILDENDKIVEYIAMRQDVTKLETINNHLEKKIEEETEKNRQNDKEHIKVLNSILDGSPNPIIIYDKDIVKYVNVKFLNLTNLDKSDIINKPFKLESLFDGKEGTIASIKDIDTKLPVNKVSISLDFRRNIFNLNVDNIYYKEYKQLTMYTFNNITMIEYQQLKIDSYNERLCMDNKYYKSVKDKNIKIDITPSNTTNNKETNDRIAIDVEQVDAKTFIVEIGSTVIDKIEEFQDNVNDIMSILYELEISSAETFSSKLDYIIKDFYEFQRIIDSLATFPTVVKSFNNIASFLNHLSVEQLEDQLKRDLLVNTLIATLKDLELWIDTVFIKSSADDIHFLDETFLSNSLQIEALFNDDEIELDDDSFEFF